MGDGPQVGHRERRVPHLLHEGADLLGIGGDGFVCNLIQQVGCALFLEAAFEVFGQQRLEFLRHPDQPLVPAIREQELARGQKHLAAPHEPRGLLAAADAAGERRESHADGSVVEELPVDDHHAVALGHIGADSLEAAAARHGMIHDGVSGEALDGLVAVGINVVVDALPNPAHRVQAFALLDRLVGAGLVNLVGGLTVEPIVSAAQAEPLGRNDADMIRREGLAKQARVEGVHRLIGHGLQSPVAVIVSLACHREAFLNFFRIRDHRHFDLVHDRRVI